jgi:transposase
VRAFEFYQGVPKLVVPDNTKTGVTKACRYDPDLNPTYQEMAMHYGVGVVPAIIPPLLPHRSCASFHSPC